MKTEERTSARATFSRALDQLDPKVMHETAIGELDELFRSGSAPDPLPDGFLPGRLVTMTLARPADATVRSIGKLYMPWLGKSFNRDKHEGVNILSSSALKPMRLLWPSYEPESQSGDRVEAFPFRTRVAAGAVDGAVQVLKIDYDFDANPNFMIRHILDELVQIEDGLYLGKILYRTKKKYVPIGFFSLES